MRFITYIFLRRVGTSTLCFYPKTVSSQLRHCISLRLHERRIWSRTHTINYCRGSNSFGAGSARRAMLAPTEMCTGCQRDSRSLRPARSDDWLCPIDCVAVPIYTSHVRPHHPTFCAVRLPCNALADVSLNGKRRCWRSVNVAFIYTDSHWIYHFLPTIHYVRFACRWQFRYTFYEVAPPQTTMAVSGRHQFYKYKVSNSYIKQLFYQLYIHL